MLLWQCDAAVARTAKDAIKLFCREFWAQERKPRKVQGETFQVIGGRRTYRCVLRAGWPETWQVEVVAE